MKNVIITGSNGMIGGLILQNCLNNPEINKITTLVRKKTGLVHEKLNEIIHDNFLDFSAIENAFQNQDVCFYCIGVYTGQVPRDEFAKITIDFTKAFATVLRKKNDKTTFCFLSGQGADSTEKSNVMFARDKGIAENFLFGLKFNQTYTFRPGYIYPVTKRVEPNFLYRLMRVLYKPLLSKVFPNNVITSEKVANTMVAVGLNGASNVIFENKDIRRFLV
jgi:nucleoside-diphosphate-sugar epimerase